MTLFRAEIGPVRRLIGCAVLTLVLLAGCGGGGGGSVNIQPFDLSAGIAITDFNGDGHLDIAYVYSHVAGPPPHPGYVSVMGFTYSVGSDPSQVIAVDLNNDGAPDVVVASSTDLITILFNDPTHPGRFLAPRQLHTGALINSIAVGDLDGDGLPDIAVAGPSGIVVFWQDATAPGQFLPPVFVVAGASGELFIGK
ncbi:MAG: FG-GAP repeat domain-containing protein, partial [Dissulfurispiraceae bacterium]